MTMTMEIVVTASTVVAVTAVVSSYLKFLAQRHRQRADELAAAKTALIAHYDAVDKLTDDPAISDELKLVLLTVAEGISNRSVARLVAREFANGTLFKHGNRAGKNPFKDEIEALGRSRPDLVEAFSVAMKSGLLSLFLRWPETAKVFNRFAAETVDERWEAVAFERASQVTVRLVRDHNKGDNNLPSGGGMMAAAC